MESLSCAFCNPPEERVIFRNQSWYAILDAYPVSPGHTLIIPHRHIESFFETTSQEKTDLLKAIECCKKIIDEKHRPDGYNIGVNIGKAAGQTIMHTHVHLIPRYLGDLEDPRGGVRGVIPDKRIY